MRKLAAGVLVVTLCGASGCAALLVGGAGAAGYAYYKGEKRQFYPYPVAQTWTAVRQAVADMGLPVACEAADQLGARLDTRTADGKRVTVRLVPRGQGTEVRVRAGVFGDEYVSRRIFAQLNQQLAGQPCPGAQAVAGSQPQPAEKTSL